MTSPYAKQIDELANQSRALAEGQARTHTLLECIPTIKEAISDMRVEMAEVKTTVKGLHKSCPHKIDIARGMNNIKKVEKLEGDVEALKEKQHEDRLEVMKGWAKVALVAAIGGGTVKGAEALFSLFN